MSIFDGRKVVSTLQKDFVKGAWTKIRSKLVDHNTALASFLKDEVQLILKDVDFMGVDISPLKSLLESFFKMDFFYDQARSSLADKAVALEKS
ncbi:hypothetical protein KY290_011776 [Solanum tuberosum]|uniref:Uncharacterized protein n=1 Tax=Solanum tuberosum TaxID=4113 RepID=A0ABQ7W1L7_SOLTU|nr:hypothetical protein KY289_012295 [Solanum tuberosum]KAH0710442.1 hypothetical protein KY284_011869 [Solanum tuberosum]KAH0736084.1 hypothetical protein KY285_011791 [Solanum tuberosum]KAH0774639.1 hypothetical protein KY290_011776 [Solanum tuberosum]